MKCQILFSEKNKKNISVCHLLKILPRVLSVNLLCCRGFCWCFLLIDAKIGIIVWFGHLERFIIRFILNHWSFFDCRLPVIRWLTMWLHVPYHRCNQRDLDQLKPNKTICAFREQFNVAFVLRFYGSFGSCRAKSVYLTTLLLGGLSPLRVNQCCAHSFARNWQLPFLNQRNGESDRRKYFMINSPWKNVGDLAGVEPTTSWSPVGCASNWATKAGHILWVHTVEPRYLELAYFELPLISKWKSCPCFNMKLWQQVTK